MCGMVGEFGQNPDINWVNFELARGNHRGPDNSSSLFVTPSVAMGANRLAMVDRLPRSNQPMQNSSTGSTITFNGEIYNHESLRKTLEKDGCIFKTESDTEVLLVGLEKYGVDFLQKVNGMYAFAFFDANTNKLVFCRDLLGKKPLYLSTTRTGIRWSSQASSLWNDARPINNEAIECYFRFGYVIDPLTPITGVFAVAPGEAIEIDLESRLERRIRISGLPQVKLTGFRELLTKAVESRTYPNDLIGISLSGGLDSTLVAIICKDLGLNVNSYTAKWTDSDKPGYNEDAECAKIIAKELGIKHNEVEMIQAVDVPENLLAYVRAMEEPNNNPTGISMLALYSQMHKDGIRLSLTGDGADELFGGYARYENMSKFHKLMNVNSDRWVNSHRNKILRYYSRAISAQLNQTNFSFWATWHEVFSQKEISKLTKRKSHESTSRFFSGILPTGSQKLFRLMQEQDLLVWIGMESNRRLDRVSMNYSIEARSPFLDDELIQYAFSKAPMNRFIPKVDFFMSEFPELEKLPVIKSKKGFISPIGHWLRGNPSFVKIQMEYLVNNFGFNKEIIEELMRSPGAGDFENIKKLWSLLTFSVWAEFAGTGFKK